MKLIILLYIFIFSALQLYSQSTYVNINGDTITFLSKIYNNQKRIFVFLSSKSCTGCKDNLNKFLSEVDTPNYRIIIVRELSNNSNLLKREFKSDINNYFTKYNFVLFKLASDDSLSPYITLMDKENNEINLEYKLIFDGVLISAKAKEILTQFME
jgi:thioredoxin-related protein